MQVEEAVDELREPLRRLVDDPEVALARGGVLIVLQHQLRKSEDAVQWRAKLLVKTKSKIRRHLGRGAGISEWRQRLFEKCHLREIRSGLGRRGEF